jgi:hypothetical protein
LPQSLPPSLRATAKVSNRQLEGAADGAVVYVEMSRIRAQRKRTKALETRDRQHGQPCRIQNTGFASVIRLSEPVLRILWIEYRVVEMFRRHVRERKLLEEFDIIATESYVELFDAVLLKPLTFESLEQWLGPGSRVDG